VRPWRRCGGAANRRLASTVATGCQLGARQYQFKGRMGPQYVNLSKCEGILVDLDRREDQSPLLVSSRWASNQAMTAERFQRFTLPIL
jgi:hypothetical protein